MLTQDQEKVIKASDTAVILVEELRGLVVSDNLLLSDVALEILEKAAQIKQRLDRIKTILAGAEM